MSVIGELLVEINGDNSGLKKSLGDSGNAVTAGVGKMVSAIGLASLAWKGVDLAMQGIDYNKAAEQAEIAFGVFLGSSSAAVNMIEKMRDLAKETPLEFADVRDAGLKLQAFGVATEKIIPSMRMLSDVSAGLQIPIKDLAYLFGSVQAQGKALTVDLMQFANRGIPIWTELAKVTGKQGVELKKMVEEGKIGFPQVEQAFKNMTSEGGKFFNMAVKQMDSLAGAQSNLNDSFDVWLGYMTSGATPALKEMAKASASFFSGWIEFDKTLKIVEWHIMNTLGHLSGVQKTILEVNDDLHAQKATWAALEAWGAGIKKQEEEKAALVAKANEEAKKANEEAKARFATEETIKTSYGAQVDFIQRMIETSKTLSANKAISDAQEATAQQIVLGYQNQAIANQILANDLQTKWNELLVLSEEEHAKIVESMNAANASAVLLSGVFETFGQTTLSNVTKLAGELGGAVQNVFSTGKADAMAFANIAASVFDVWVKEVTNLYEYWQKMADAFAGSEVKRQNKLAKQRAKENKKESEELLDDAKESMMTEQQLLDKHYAEMRTKYENSADALNNTRAWYSIEKGKIDKKATEKAAEEAKKLADIAAEAQKKIEDGWKSTGEKISSAMTSAFSGGKTAEEFRKSFLDMLRNMAIDAAVLTESFKEQFKSIGKMISDALSDGVISESELIPIDLQVNRLYSEASGKVGAINQLFDRASGGQVSNGSSVSININTTNDPLAIASAIGDVSGALAYRGVI